MPYREDKAQANEIERIREMVRRYEQSLCGGSNDALEIREKMERDVYHITYTLLNEIDRLQPNTSKYGR